MASTSSSVRVSARKPTATPEGADCFAQATTTASATEAASARLISVPG
ncbi:hypothetical protein ACWCSD_03535 [Nonomuraea sp. NPDC001684]